MDVTVVACLQDNYAYLVHGDGALAVVDPSEAEPIIAALAGRTPDEIWLTHHHHDHVGGVAALRAAFPRLRVRASMCDRDRIAHVTDVVGDGFHVGKMSVTALATPGHTLGAVTYVTGGAAFTGDTLFSAGCGRLFEGTAETMFASLRRIAALPDDTRIYCGHEYFLANLRFALAMGLDVAADIAAATALRARGTPTVPTTLAAERRHNIFLRADTAQRFAELRTAKDQFAG